MIKILPIALSLRRKFQLLNFEPLNSVETVIDYGNVLSWTKNILNYDMTTRL